MFHSSPGWHVHTLHFGWLCIAAPAAWNSAYHPARVACLQVYRGMLAPGYGGTEVAVKVQRPDVRRGVGLDLYLMHGLASLLRRLPQACQPLPLGFRGHGIDQQARVMCGM